MFQPIVPLSGFAGWSFLTRTLESQKETYANSPEVARDVAYFKENIGKVQTAEDLVADHTLLKVALEAFGLGDDIGNKFFIRKVLEEGTLTDDALANKLSDDRYLKFSQAFGFGDFSVPSTALSDFGEKITSAFKEQQFEEAVGDQNEDFRLALGISRDLSDIAEKDLEEDTLWYSVMGNTALREVFETVFNLPSSFSSLDLDKQLETFKDRSQSTFGDSGIKQFTSEEKQEELTRLFLIRSEVRDLDMASSSSQNALTLLQNAGTSPYSLL